MDLLFLLPVLGYLLSPHVASWATSANILVFYVNWAGLVLSHPAVNIHIAGVLIVRLVCWLLPSLLTLVFDLILPYRAARLKLAGGASLPPRRLMPVLRVTALALANLALTVGAEYACSSGFRATARAPLLRTSAITPRPWLLFRHLVILCLAREVLGHYIHWRILHARVSSGLLAALFVRPHARYVHGYAPRAPFSLLLFADSPLPSLMLRFVPVFLPAVLLRPHILTYLLFLALTTIEETMAMSGYSVVPGLYMRGVVRRTALHFASAGRVNYGHYGLLDHVHGTRMNKRSSAAPSSSHTDYRHRAPATHHQQPHRR